MKPPKLTEGQVLNFETLKRACLDGNLALISAIRKADQKPVALVCAMNKDGEAYMPAPLAVLIEDNPYELFEDPLADIDTEEEEQEQLRFDWGDSSHS